MYRIFGDWSELVDTRESLRLIPVLIELYKSNNVCPNKKDVFKAFTLFKPNECKVVFIGQDPYPQRNVATGILFGNKSDTNEENYSPSLKVIRDAIKNLENPNNVYTFDPSLEYLAKQGVLMLNSALTVEMNKIGSHTMYWRRFMTKLVTNLSIYNNTLVWVLFGELAHTFAPYIYGGKVFKVKHPAYYARTNTPMPYDIFNDVNNYLMQYNTKINWCNVKLN